MSVHANWIYLIIYASASCIYTIREPYACLEDSRGHQKCSYRQLLDTMWVLEIKPVSSARAVIAPNFWVISHPFCALTNVSPFLPSQFIVTIIYSPLLGWYNIAIEKSQENKYTAK